MSEDSILVSVHFPKAGGKSTQALLSDAFGAALVIDTDDDPHRPLSPRHLDPVRYMTSTPQLPSAARAVHGHFHPGKYSRLDGARFFTILRHPVPWIVSLYWYWHSAADGRLRGRPVFWGDLHEYLIRERLTIEEVAQLPIVNRMFSHTYFGSWDMRRFQYVGRHEDRGSAMRALSAMVGAPVSQDRRENVNPPRPEIGETLNDTSTISRLTDILGEEIAFYERWTADSNFP